MHVLLNNCSTRQVIRYNSYLDTSIFYYDRKVRLRVKLTKIGYSKILQAYWRGYETKSVNPKNW